MSSDCIGQHGTVHFHYILWYPSLLHSRYLVRHATPPLIYGYLGVDHFTFEGGARDFIQAQFFFFNQLVH